MTDNDKRVFGVEFDDNNRVSQITFYRPGESPLKIPIKEGEYDVSCDGVKYKIVIEKGGDGYRVIISADGLDIFRGHIP